MHIAICDDELRELDRLSALLTEYETSRDTALSVRAFQNATDLLAGLRGGEYDVVLLDVMMPGLGGLQAARELRELDQAVRIIFLTASPEFAVDSYAVKAYHYLLKPATPKTLFPLLDKACSELEDREEALLIKGRDGLVRLPLAQLESVEVMNKTVFFRLVDGSVRELNAALSDFEDALLSHPEFVKVHRSYLLNLWQLQSVGAKGAITKTGRTVPVARAMYAAVKDAYMRLLFQPKSPPQEGVPGRGERGSPDGAWHILIVDDEPMELSAWSDRLRARGCIVATAQTSAQALRLVTVGRFDCVLLDVVLADEDGFALCGRLREHTDAPMIFLSSMTEAQHQLQGFAVGGVDYITKDTPADLFWTKVDTRIRLARTGRTKLSFGQLLLDLSRRKVTLGGDELVLTPTEFDLVWLLAARAPHVCTPQELYRAVWSAQQWDGGQTVQVHMSRLRRKVEKAYPRHYFLETVWGEGYRFVPETDREVPE